MSTHKKARTAIAVSTLVRANKYIRVRGGGTKTALSGPASGGLLLDVGDLRGVIEYDPHEYTFTAYAGTPVRDINAQLQKHGQYLPFDPIFVERGATLGGSVAANTSGSGRYRYGGIRDFILGIEFVDGKGRLVRSGGKVVKNSAGFDLPKFMVGSLGEFGVLTEVSFKVFPQPRAHLTIQATYSDLNAALQAVWRLGTKPFDIEALDLEPAQGQVVLVCRIGGIEAALSGQRDRIISYLQNDSEILGAVSVVGAEERSFWRELNAFAWARDAHLVKIPVPARMLLKLDARIEDLGRRYAVAGNVAWVSCADVSRIGRLLTELQLPGLHIVGTPGVGILGPVKGESMRARMKAALDPQGKFVEA